MCAHTCLAKWRPIFRLSIHTSDFSHSYRVIRPPCPSNPVEKKYRMTWSNAIVGTNESLAKAKYACLKQRSWLYWSLTAVYTPCGHQIFMGCNLSQKLALPFCIRMAVWTRSQRYCVLFTWAKLRYYWVANGTFWVWWRFGLLDLREHL